MSIQNIKEDLENLKGRNLKVPDTIRKEIKDLGLTIGFFHGGKELYAVTTSYFVQKNNKDNIKKLKMLGWIQGQGYIMGGLKYTKFSKRF